MKTISLTRNEYSNFIQVANHLAIKFTQIIKDSFILITADADTLVELGYDK